MMKKPTPEEAVAVTFVFWDINTCPVPDGFDAALARLHIKFFLETYGYHGPLNVTAFGKLTDVPIAMLRRVFSGGIDLKLVPYGTIDIFDLIDSTVQPPSNFMLISHEKACPGISSLSNTLERRRFNPLQPFPMDFESLTRDADALCFSRTDFLQRHAYRSALWDCTVCARDPPSRCFECFITHEEHLDELKFATNRPPPPPPAYNPVRRGNVELVRLVNPPLRCGVIDWEAVKKSGDTVVFWDINSCPVPPGCDASLVGPCIKRFLKKEGCCGSLSITAIGVLTDVPNDILRKVFSCGINLRNVPYGPSNIADLIYNSYKMSGPPCNIMVISNARIFACLPQFIKLRFNLLDPFPNEFFLQSVLDSGEVEDDKCSDHPFCICSLCDNKSDFQGFEKFAIHLSCRYHQEKLSELLPISKPLQHLSAPLREPPEKNLEAVTLVFWDIKMYPLPGGFNPRLFGPLIKRFLEDFGYSGPLTITAIGVLTDVPNDILEGVYSSGINLDNISSGVF